MECPHCKREIKSVIVTDSYGCHVVKTHEVNGGQLGRVTHHEQHVGRRRVSTCGHCGMLLHSPVFEEGQQ